MKIRDMFARDINRDINGVVKVDQNDDAIIKQELEEYIITKEIDKHLRAFMSSYAESLRAATDKMGVWISGFFGSGKSHFLKILSYLLANEEIDGTRAIDVFRKTIDDPKFIADIESCVSVPTESILFNVDIVGPGKKDETAILNIFARMFYSNCGFYEHSIQIAKLEQFIAKAGKSEEFRSAYLQRLGMDIRWEDDRSNFAFREDEIIGAMMDALGMSEEAARSWYRHDYGAEMTIKSLAQEIKEYVEGKEGGFRLLFMADEVGQYIGDNASMMLNLQSLTEELGNLCGGKVWIIVTSQEAMDQVTVLKGSDFSKILGRFATRINLSSSSVDEVIKLRVLDKKPDARVMLMKSYDTDHVTLSNLFTFSGGSVTAARGYASADEYASTFPFLPYQFRTVQDVFQKIRQHGHSGRHLAGGERSMLSAFKDAAVKMQDRDEHSFAPFAIFYDTVKGFLEGVISRVIDRAQAAADEHRGLEPEDVDVLKTLYLVRYIDDFAPTIENIAVLSVRDLNADKAAMKASIQASLGRLMRENYVSRDGESWHFLTDEEQEVSRDIRSIPTDPYEVAKRIKEIIFDDIYNAPKYQRGHQTFSIDKMIDDTSFQGAAGGDLRIRILTSAKPFAGASRHQIIGESAECRDVTVILSSDPNYPYDKLIEESLRIDTYTRKNNIAKMPERKQRIVSTHIDRKRNIDKQAKEAIERCLRDAEVYVLGDKVDIPSVSAADKIKEALGTLVDEKFRKFALVDSPVDENSEIAKILAGDMAGRGLLWNDRAIKEIEAWIDEESVTRTPTMDDIHRRFQGAPYGWREIDIAALTARLIADQKIELRYGASPLLKDDARIIDLMRKAAQRGGVQVRKRVGVSEELLKNVRKLLMDLLGIANVPNDEDGLVKFIVELLAAKHDSFETLKAQYTNEHYPGVDKVRAADDLVASLRSHKVDATALMSALLDKRDELTNAFDAVKQVEEFFGGGQKKVFDDAYTAYKRLADERSYYSENAEAQYAIGGFEAIYRDESPFSKIMKLPQLASIADKCFKNALAARQEAVAASLESSQKMIEELTDGVPGAEAIASDASADIEARRKKVAGAERLTDLDALSAQAMGIVDGVRAKIEALLATPPAAVPAGDQDEPIEPPKPAPKIATIRRSDLCPLKKLSSAADVDDYVSRIRSRLMRELEGYDSVKVM